MKKPAAFPIVVLLILLWLIAPFSSASAEPQGVATVIAIRGTVVAQNKSGTSRNLSLKSQIFREDVLKTGDSGKLQIMFTDNSIISLGRDSEMKIAEYRWQPEQKDGALKTQVKEGTFRVMGGALAKEAPENFKTETPTATIGIRGSMYAFKSTQDSLSVLFQGGKGIEVFNSLGKVTITTPGFGTSVLLNAPPARPAKLKEQEINDLNQQFNGNGENGGGGEQPAAAPPAEGGPEAGPAPEPAPEPAPAPAPEPEPLPLPLPPSPVPVPPVLPPLNEYPTAPDFTQPPAPPTDGIFAFTGMLTGLDKDSSGSIIGSFTNDLMIGVNWHNHRFLGVAYDDYEKDEPVFFFGSVNGSTVSDLTIFGTDFGWQNNKIGIISGGGLGSFAGSAYDFFAFNATGTTSLIPPILTPYIQGSWVVAGGVQQIPEYMTPVAPRGTEYWQGFVTGQSMEIANTSSQHAVYQSAPGGFTLTVNKDAGTLNGIMTPGSPLPVFDDNFATLSNLRIGGSTTNSVYVQDNLMAALITGGSGSPTLAPQGASFMVVADPLVQPLFSSYLTWGYWQIAYIDSTSNTERIMPSLWIAGNPTPTSVINDLHNTNFTGIYNGKAIGTEFYFSGGQSSVIGTCALTANFGPGTISGNISFPNATLPISTGSIPSNQFTATISGNGFSGTANGGFFGPAANAVGGNFGAASSDKAYLGIFGANR